MADLVIRQGTVSDIQAIMALEQGSIEHPWESKAIESLITDGNKVCLVAELDGVIVSYVGAESVLDESNVGNIVTHRECRGRGIATKLFEALLAELKEKGIRKLFLEVECLLRLIHYNTYLYHLLILDLNYNNHRIC